MTNDYKYENDKWIGPKVQLTIPFIKADIATMKKEKPHTMLVEEHIHQIEFLLTRIKYSSR